MCACGCCGSDLSCTRVGVCRCLSTKQRAGRCLPVRVASPRKIPVRCPAPLSTNNFGTVHARLSSCWERCTRHARRLEYWVSCRPPRVRTVCDRVAAREPWRVGIFTKLRKSPLLQTTQLPLLRLEHPQGPTNFSRGLAEIGKITQECGSVVGCTSLFDHAPQRKRHR